MNGELPCRLAPDGISASAALADWLARTVEQALDEASHIAIAVPGGTTPGPFLSAFAKKNLPWPRITLLPTDERLVPPDHMRSNDGMVRRYLAPALERGAEWLGFAPVTAEADAATHRDALLHQIRPLLPLTALVSGMGEDGHICSLFPGDPQVMMAASKPLLIARPKGLEPRLSLGPSVLQAAGARALLFGGASKIAIMLEAMQPGLEIDLPVRLLLGSGRDTQIFAWR